MNTQDFRKHAHELVDWMADYFENIEKYPVKSQVQPGEIYCQLPDSPPENGESMEKIMADFEKIILPGITHWQSPNFHAFFTANSSYPSVLAEMLTATLGAQCMIWETSPAAAELEEQVLNWLKEMLALPSHFEGVIQDTASSATLCAILTAREKASNYQTNQQGLAKNSYRIYCSTQTHSSVDKAVRIAGLGHENLVKVEVDEEQALKPLALQSAIEADLQAGLHPLCVVASLGTTGTTAVDPLAAIAQICVEHKIWLHVDAAFSGTALVLPEFRWIARGLEFADSFVFNPHKWMFTNFDCSAYYVKDVQALIQTFSILPEYLKTKTRGLVNDYRDWGIALGRRFRALKLWFVIRTFGVEGIRERVRFHIDLAKNLSEVIAEHPHFEIMAPTLFNALFFRFKPALSSEDELNTLNEQLVHALNESGSIYLTHTKISGKYIIRMVIGQTYVEERHVKKAWKIIQETAHKLGG
ncbi:MAG: aspartate aminotransferase family protein [Deferribacteres bacterium]|nr:aspartate aminotransferase family protein [candidate division KSB1 bacterium]MCB9500437.1 aspartate aminotransferase family protein [Deferribacteres bacterium]